MARRVRRRWHPWWLGWHRWRQRRRWRLEWPHVEAEHAGSLVSSKADDGVPHGQREWCAIEIEEGWYRFIRVCEIANVKADVVLDGVCELKADWCVVRPLWRACLAPNRCLTRDGPSLPQVNPKLRVRSSGEHWKTPAA